MTMGKYYTSLTYNINTCIETSGGNSRRNTLAGWTPECFKSGVLFMVPCFTKSTLP